MDQSSVGDKFIIVKYASQFTPGEKADPSCSVVNTFSAVGCGIKRKFYDSKEDASHDLEKLREFNPCVDYGVVLTRV
jgi:hypothetical protein